MTYASGVPVDPVLRWNAARIPVQRRGRTLEDLALPGSVLSEARAFVDTFAQRHLPETLPMSQYPADRELIGRGALLSGLPKTGKTSLGCAILTEVSLTAPEYPPVNVLFVPWPDYMHFFNERHSWRERRDMTFEENLVNLEVTLDRVMQASLVLFDDVGAEHATASKASADEMYRVLRSRHRRGLVSMVATLLSPKELAESYSPALSDFLLRDLDHIRVTVSGARR